MYFEMSGWALSFLEQLRAVALKRYASPEGCMSLTVNLSASGRISRCRGQEIVDCLPIRRRVCLHSRPSPPLQGSTCIPSVKSCAPKTLGKVVSIASRTRRLAFDSLLFEQSYTSSRTSAAHYKLQLADLRFLNSISNSRATLTIVVGHKMGSIGRVTAPRILKDTLDTLIRE